MACALYVVTVLGITKEPSVREHFPKAFDGKVVMLPKSLILLILQL
jgi:hypothetical protein